VRTGSEEREGNPAELAQRREQAVVGELIAGFAREARVDLGRSRMRDGVSDDYVAVHGAFDGSGAIIAARRGLPRLGPP
jgi:hypothetical protein